MTLFLYLLFTASVCAVFYSYVLFPFILKILAKGKKPDHFPEISDSGVSIIISVYNEERVIKEKILSILNSDYPKDKIEILIGSDFSSDKTGEIVREFSKHDSRIKLFEFKERRGKPAIVNDLIKLAENSLIILTDANVYFERMTIQKLASNFINPKVGLVGANILNVGMRKDGISNQEKLYIERENLIKYREGLIFGTMMGPFGGCYMIRKELYTEVPNDSLVDDFFIAMKVLEKKYSSLNEMKAICYEDIPNEMKDEFRRKVRISSGNFQNLSRMKMFLLNPFHAAGFCFISHKYLRWITPLFILISLVCSYLLMSNSVIFKILFWGELGLLLFPFLDYFLKKIKLNIKLLRFISYFTMMNLALIIGYVNYRKGIKSGVWKPTKRLS